MKIMQFFVNNPDITHIHVQLVNSFAYISRGVAGWSYLMRSLDVYNYDVIGIDRKTHTAILRKQEV